MSVVYHAVQENLGREVALKLLYSHHASSHERRERFYNEARLMAKLIHPNIVQLFNLLELNNTIVLVMEYVKGKSLDHIIGREIGPMPWETALPLFMQMLEGMTHAHVSGIVHRDLKPSNVMVSESQVAKVGDFGVAKILGEKGLTKAGATQPGTLAYMSPEQVMGRKLDYRSDIYSLGVTLYEMLSGRLPLADDYTGEFEIMNAIIREKLPDPREFYPHIPDWLVRVVKKSISKKPERRFESCLEFKSELESGLRTGNVSVSARQTSPFHTIRKGLVGIMDSLRLSPGSGRVRRTAREAAMSDEERQDWERRKKEQLEALLQRGDDREKPEKTEKKRQLRTIISEDEVDEEARQKIRDEEIKEEFEDLIEEYYARGERVEGEEAEKEEDKEEEAAPQEELEEEAGASRVRAFIKDTWPGRGVAAAAIVGIGFGALALFGSKGSNYTPLVPKPDSTDPGTPRLLVSDTVSWASEVDGVIAGVTCSEDGHILAYDRSGFVSAQASENGWSLSSMHPSDSIIPMGATFLDDSTVCYSIVDDMKLRFMGNHFEERDSTLGNFHTRAPRMLQGVPHGSLIGVIPFVDNLLGNIHPLALRMLHGMPHGSLIGVIPYVDTLSVDPLEKWAGFRVCRWNGSTETEVVYSSIDYDISGELTAVGQHRIYTSKPIYAVSHNGVVAFAERSSSIYRIQLYLPEGDSLATIRYSLTPVAKTPEEIAAERRRFERAMEEPGSEWEPDPNRLAIRSMGFDNLGRLWARRGTEISPVFDVFDAAGQHLYTVGLAEEIPYELKTAVLPQGILAWPASESQRQDLLLLELQAKDPLCTDSANTPTLLELASSGG